MTDDMRIVQLTEHMRFERKTAITPREKAVYSALTQSVGDALHQLQKLNLRLWQATQGDYRSLPMDEARALLKEASVKIDVALAQCPQDADEI